MASHRLSRSLYPAYWILRLASSLYVIDLLTRLDDELPIEEFTVGYHIEAMKS